MRKHRASNESPGAPKQRNAHAQGLPEVGGCLLGTKRQVQSRTAQPRPAQAHRTQITRSGARQASTDAPTVRDLNSDRRGVTRTAAGLSRAAGSADGIDVEKLTAAAHLGDALDKQVEVVRGCRQNSDRQC